MDILARIQFLKDLTAAVGKVCPIAGVTIGSSLDRKSWIPQYLDGVTDAQKDAAKKVIDVYPQPE